MAERVSNSHEGGVAGPLRVLIVRVGAMGDVLHGMPAVAALRAAVPGCEIGWAVEPRWAALLQASPESAAGSPEMPLVDRVHLVPARAWGSRPVSLSTMRSVLQLRRALREAGYDVCIDLQGSIRSAVIGWMSAARLLVGMDAPRERQARIFYGQRVRVTLPHVIEQAGEVLRAGLDGRVAARALPVAPLPVDAAAERWCDALLQGDGRRIVVMAASAGWGAKQWPAARYGAVAARLAAEGFRVLVNAVPGVIDGLADGVVASSGGAAEAVGCTLAQLMALLRRSALFAGGDTGPMHLAAALQVPVVALFGPTDPARNGPFGARAIVLRSALSVTDHKRHAAAEAGLLRIEVDAVCEAAMELLHGESGKGVDARMVV